jgi:hypothetical protein
MLIFPESFGLDRVVFLAGKTIGSSKRAIFKRTTFKPMQKYDSCGSIYLEMWSKMRIFILSI